MQRVIDARCEQCGGVRQRSVGAGYVKRRAQPTLGLERLADFEAREAGGFGFFGDRRGPEETGSDREPARPATGVRERRHARTEERPVLAMNIQTEHLPRATGVLTR